MKWSFEKNIGLVRFWKNKRNNFHKIFRNYWELKVNRNELFENKICDTKNSNWNETFDSKGYKRTCVKTQKKSEGFEKKGLTAWFN